MAAFSKEQFWHISPAGFYQIKEFISLPPVSSKSSWEKPRKIREMLKTKLNQNIISLKSEKSTWRSLIVENQHLMPGSYQQDHVPALPVADLWRMEQNPSTWETFTAWNSKEYSFPDYRDTFRRILGFFNEPFSNMSTGAEERRNAQPAALNLPCVLHCWHWLWKCGWRNHLGGCNTDVLCI